MTALTRSEQRDVEPAQLLGRLWGISYESTFDMAADMGRLQVWAQALLDIIDRITEGESQPDGES